MNDAGHIVMKQAHLLGISGSRKIYGEGCSLYESVGRRRLSPNSPKVREPAGTAHDRLWIHWIRKLGNWIWGRTRYRLEKRSGIAVGYECHGMDLVRHT